MLTRVKHRTVMRAYKDLAKRRSAPCVRPVFLSSWQSKKMGGNKTRPYITGLLSLEQTYTN